MQHTGQHAYPSNEHHGHPFGDEVLRRIAALDLRQRLGAVLPESAETAIDLMEPYQGNVK